MRYAVGEGRGVGIAARGIGASLTRERDRSSCGERGRNDRSPPKTAAGSASCSRSWAKIRSRSELVGPSGVPGRIGATLFSRTRPILGRRKGSERPLGAENGSQQRELQPVLGGKQVEIGARGAFGSVESSVGTAATRPGGRNYLKNLWFKRPVLVYVAGPIASRPARTNGRPGGKQPRGNRASRSPARRYSAASRKARANQA